MFTHCVYWIHNPEHDNLSEGYIGVTKLSHFANRILCHRQSKVNHLVRKALEGGALIDIIFHTSKEHALEIERELRPKKYLGWNIACGGTNMPSQKGRTYEYLSTADSITKRVEGRKQRMKDNPYRGHTKLTEDNVRAIRAQLDVGLTMYRLAKDYKVTPSTIKAIRDGHAWSNIN